MVKVTLVTTKSCAYCPMAKDVWRRLQKKLKFDYEEVDASSEKGMRLVQQYNIMSVPSTIIDNKVAFVGVPDEDKATEAVRG